MVKHIKKTIINGIKVSTVQLPNDEFYRGFYETVVLSHGYEFERRSGTYKQAMNDHQQGIEYARGLK